MKLTTFLLLFVALWVLYSCVKAKDPILCSVPPPYVSFELIDSAGRDMFDTNTPGHFKTNNFHVYYREEGVQKEVEMAIYMDTLRKDSLPHVTYVFGSNDMAFMSADKGIKDYYLSLGGITDTLHVDVAWLHNGCANTHTKSLRFKGKSMLPNQGDYYTLPWP